MAGKKEFSATEVMMLQERLEKGITVIGEQVTELNSKMGKVEGRLDTVEEKMDIVVASIPNKVNKSEFNQLERRVEVLETKPA